MVTSTASASEKSASKESPKNQETAYYHIQDFQDGQLKIQFRYINGVLHYIQFLNTSTKSVKLRILDKSYVLGVGDSLV